MWPSITRYGEYDIHTLQSIAMYLLRNGEWKIWGIFLDRASESMSNAQHLIGIYTELNKRDKPVPRWGGVRTITTFKGLQTWLSRARCPVFGCGQCKQTATHGYHSAHVGSFVSFLMIKPGFDHTISARWIDSPQSIVTIQSFTYNYVIMSICGLLPMAATACHM